MLAARIESDEIEYVRVYMISYLKYYTQFILSILGLTTSSYNIIIDYF